MASTRQQAPAPAPAAPAPPTRERIVEAALRLFSERGTIATSMRDLAVAAGVTVPGLYYHFASKAELIRAVYQARGLATVLTGDTLDPLPDHLEARVAEQGRREFFRLVEEADFLQLMVTEAIRHEPDALEVGKEMGDAWRARWAEVLAGASDVDPHVDLAPVAGLITTFLWGTFVRFLMRPDPALPAQIDDLARLVARATTRPPTRPRKARRRPERQAP